MHNAALAVLNLEGSYELYPVEPERLVETLPGLLKSEVDGLNVTAPYKSAVVPFLDGLAPCAKRIGAVNTIYRQGSLWMGANTDAAGFLRAIRHTGKELRGAHVTVLGSGGAAQAALDALASAEVSRISVVARNTDARQARRHQLRKQYPNIRTFDYPFGPTLGEVFSDSDILVQATSASMQSEEEATRFANSLPLDRLPSTSLVTDLVYQPLRTAVIEKASALGLSKKSGEAMLYYQAAASLEFWTDESAPFESMAAALSDAISGR
jgi:shikimate dehydrogenase